jgi:hypothetical protein
MTSQVAVMNQDGIAVASDTMVTIGDKTIPNMSKLVEFGAGHKFLVMMSGNAEINGISVRALLTQWMSQLQSADHYKSLEAYVAAFTSWVRDEDYLPTSMFNMEVEDHLLKSIAHGQFTRIESLMRNRWYEGGAAETAPEFYTQFTKSVDGIDVEDYKINTKAVSYARSVLNEILQNEITRLRQDFPLFPLWEPEAGRKWLERRGFGVIETVIDAFQFPIFSSEISVTQKTKELMRELFAEGVSRAYPRDSDTELAFVGYGHDDYFPTLVTLVCRGVYGDMSLVFTSRPEPELDFERARGFKSTLVTSTSKARVEFFAQTDAIDGFLNGISDAKHNTVRRVAYWAMQDIVRQEFPDLHFDEQVLRNAANRLIEAISYNLNESADSNLTPVFENSVSAMSLTNMIELARSMVSMQALSMYGREGASTVGGRIETATIDRVYGVRWHDRLTIPQ